MDGDSTNENASPVSATHLRVSSNQVTNRSRPESVKVRRPLCRTLPASPSFRPTSLLMQLDIAHRSPLFLAAHRLIHSLIDFFLPARCRIFGGIFRSFNFLCFLFENLRAGSGRWQRQGSDRSQSQSEGDSVAEGARKGQGVGCSCRRRCGCRGCGGRFRLAQDRKRFDVAQTENHQRPVFAGSRTRPRAQALRRKPCPAGRRKRRKHKSLPSAAISFPLFRLRFVPLPRPSRYVAFLPPEFTRSPEASNKCASCRRISPNFVSIDGS